MNIKKKIIRLCFSIVSIVSAYNSGNAQSNGVQNPIVASALSFEGHPVDLFTGTPIINIPMFTLPTRSNKISLDIGLTYHPASTSEHYKNIGNAGRGWYLSGGGVIGRIIIGYPDEITTGSEAENDDIYTFNFMGMSGKFKLRRGIVETAFKAEMTENKGNEQFKIEIVQTGLTIDAIKIFDSQGIQYIFQNYDVFSIIHLNSNKTFRNSFHLSSIKDCNNNLLVSLLYGNEDVSTDTGSSGNISFLTEINSPGFGKAIYTPLNISLNSFQYNDIVIKDNFESIVKKFVLQYGTNNNDSKLTKVNILDKNDLVNSSYGLFYLERNLISDVSGFDTWGYTNTLSEYCPNDSKNGSLTDPLVATTGVLEKIILPTGGAMIYNYEASTYSYENGFRSDQTGGDEVYKVETNPNNKFNFHNQFVFSKSFSSSNYTDLTINITQPNTKVYLQFSANPYSSGPIVDINGNPFKVYPSFTLRRGGTLLKTFSGNNYYQNGDNNCMGSTYTFTTTGTYTISMDHTDLTSGSVYVHSIALNSEIKKWWYGGGIRIKNVGYFNDKSVPQNYYRLAENTTGFIPSRQLNYDYTLDSNPNISSGSLNAETSLAISTVTYKNVTVYDSSKNGKIVNTYYTPIDYPEETLSDFRTGKLLKQVVYNSLNQAVSQSDFQYTSINTIDQTDPVLEANYKMGWIMPSEIKKTEFYASGNYQNIDSYFYDSNRRITEHQQSTSKGSIDKTKTFYHTGNSPYSANRIGEPERVEQYEDNELLSTLKINYNNSWFDVSNNQLLNASYLPQEIQLSKAMLPFETSEMFNYYDAYGHPLEVQKQNGTKTVSIWGYDDSQVIATLENIGYAQIPANLITDVKTASNSSLPNAEATLLEKLKALRDALPNAMVTTYTYKPLVGVSTTTDPKGYTVYYDYDPAGRLTAVKEKDPVTQNFRLLSENKYNYKP